MPGRWITLATSQHLERRTETPPHPGLEGCRTTPIRTVGDVLSPVNRVPNACRLINATWARCAAMNTLDSKMRRTLPPSHYSWFSRRGYFPIGRMIRDNAPGR